MKAHINGVTIEGTPQEIAEYQRLQAAEGKYPYVPQKEKLNELYKQIFKPWEHTYTLLPDTIKPRVTGSTGMTFAPYDQGINMIY